MHLISSFRNFRFKYDLTKSQSQAGFSRPSLKATLAEDSELLAIFGKFVKLPRK